MEPGLLMMSTSELISVVAAALGGLAVVLGWAKAFIVAPLSAKVAQLETERDSEKNIREKTERDVERERLQARELTAQLTALRQDVANLRVGRAGAFLKADVDEDLEGVLAALDLHEGSVLVPSPTDDSTLVFLSVVGPAAASIRMTRLPTDRGLAGRVFRTGTLFNSASPRADPGFNDSVDEKAQSTTRTLLTVPIADGGRTIGVLQLLNKPGGFDASDERTAVEWATRLSPKVARFLASPDNFDALGFAWRDDLPCATVVFSDLTRSSLLLERMNVPSAVDCLNEYLGGQCESALRLGGTIDNYLGDGVMIRFGPTPSSGAETLAQAAFEAAADMLDEFERVKRSWIAATFDVEPIFVRVGIATGPVYETAVGHPSTRRLTVIGDPVNRASRLCEEAPRDRSVIVVDPETAKFRPASWEHAVAGDEAVLVAPPSN